MIKPLGHDVCRTSQPRGLRDVALKRKLHTEARMPFYLVVDPEAGEPVATPFGPDGVERPESARSASGVQKLERPFPVTIALSL